MTVGNSRCAVDTVTAGETALLSRSGLQKSRSVLVRVVRLTRLLMPEMGERVWVRSPVWAMCDG